VLVAREGSEARRRAERSAEPIHLLLTDVVMPRMSGCVLTEHLTPLRPETKVLFMSGYTDSEILDQAALAPGTAFMNKPFKPDALARAVRQALQPGAARP